MENNQPNTYPPMASISSCEVIFVSGKFFDFLLKKDFHLDLGFSSDLALAIISSATKSLPDFFAACLRWLSSSSTSSS
jgi:hypothetical protein